MDNVPVESVMLQRQSELQAWLQMKWVVDLSKPFIWLTTVSTLYKYSGVNVESRQRRGRETIQILGAIVTSVRITLEQISLGIFLLWSVNHSFHQRNENDFSTWVSLCILLLCATVFTWKAKMNSPHESLWVFSCCEMLTTVFTRETKMTSSHEYL